MPSKSNLKNQNRESFEDYIPSDLYKEANVYLYFFEPLNQADDLLLFSCFSFFCHWAAVVHFTDTNDWITYKLDMKDKKNRVKITPGKPAKFRGKRLLGKYSVSKDQLKDFADAVDINNLKCMVHIRNFQVWCVRFLQQIDPQLSFSNPNFPTDISGFFVAQLLKFIFTFFVYFLPHLFFLWSISVVNSFLYGFCSLLFVFTILANADVFFHRELLIFCKFFSFIVFKYWDLFESSSSYLLAHDIDNKNVQLMGSPFYLIDLPIALGLLKIFQLAADSFGCDIHQGGIWNVLLFWWLSFASIPFRSMAVNDTASCILWMYERYPRQKLFVNLGYIALTLCILVFVAPSEYFRLLFLSYFTALFAVTGLLFTVNWCL